MLMQRVPTEARSVCSDADMSAYGGPGGRGGDAASVDGATTVAGGRLGCVRVCVTVCVPLHTVYSRCVTV